MTYPPLCPDGLSVATHSGSPCVATRDDSAGQGNPDEAYPLLADPCLENAMSSEPALSPDRRSLLFWTTLMAGAAGLGVSSVPAAQTGRSEPQEVGGLRKGMFSFMLAHEQFPVPELVQLGALASRSGFQVLS